MPSAAQQNVHDQAPDHGQVCLLIVDMINPFTFPDAEGLVPAATAVAERIAALKRRLKEARLPTIYVNDNFGKWQSDFRRLVEHCLSQSCAGKTHR